MCEMPAAPRPGWPRGRGGARTHALRRPSVDTSSLSLCREIPGHRPWPTHVGHVVRCVRHRCALVANRHLADEIKSWKVTKFFAKPTADRGRLALPRGHWSVERVRCPVSASMVSTRRSLSLGMHLPSLWTNRHDHFL
ncbi:hypothetical protein XFF6166_240048 [Xanthomonas citri pv. fuscans]|nr:hypothetical protein XFF6166_240048 [Xanthomonas citri pv. fuscans]SOO01950.1 hypothetical protein XFF6960_540048 [Xanthomonas citri pv. fuscans]SOO04612.1 hypothetical protein XFF7767_260046 [Xanthomonas citri pv. fuscans]SOO08013.1 hypothetical protein XFF6970_140035 [Xanthomonas citri pv. fuscans]SOO13749.1 hypothetical protein XFF7766_230036 [Xanthomonas citri pv. fuscans]